MKPFIGSLSSSPSQWQDLAYDERFEWALVDDHNFEEGSGSGLAAKTGVGTAESMPYADEALVLMPTFDIRLIEAKVPLTNAKKLQQILPNLIEEYLLGGTESISVQALPPVPGRPALQRTLAVIDRLWFGWLCKQLEGLLCRKVRMVPDCFMLSLNSSSSVAPSLASMREGLNVIFTKRTGEQLGIAWVERDDAEQNRQTPPSVISGQVIEFSWDWLIPSAHAFLQENANSRAPNFALNLLPKKFKSDTIQSGFSRFTSALARKKEHDLTQDGLSNYVGWTDPIVWREPKKWALYFIAMVVMGSLLHLSWMVFDNWRWSKRIELLAAQSLTSTSVLALEQAKSSAQSNTATLPTTVTGALIKQVTQDQRRQGLPTDADFASMAAKLQQLKLSFGAEIIQQLDYDGYGIDFEFKPGAIKQSSEQVIDAGRSLGLLIKSLGANRYRLEPYAGLGAGT